MNERDTIPQAEKLAQFKCGKTFMSASDNCACGLTKSQHPAEFTPSEMLARVAKLLGIGLNPESGTPTSPASASQDEACGVDTPETPSEYTGTIPAGTWATEEQDEWAERREAFSNEGEVEP